MHVLCSKCGQEVPGNELNVATNVAHCPKCDEVFPLSSLVQSEVLGPLDLDNPPRGAWYVEDVGGFLVGATTRSPVAFFLVPFMCVWSGGSLGGIYGSQIIKGQFNLGISLFGIPFLLGTLLFGSLALMTLFGKVVVRVSDIDSSVFTGVGPVGLRRRFDWQEVTAVRVERTFSGRGQPTMTIVLDGPEKIRFGSMLSEPRRDFVANVLRHALVNSRPAQRSTS